MLEEKVVAEELVSKMLSCSLVILRLCSTPYLTSLTTGHLGWQGICFGHRDYFLFSQSTARTFDSGDSLAFLTLRRLAAFTRWETRGLWAPVRLCSAQPPPRAQTGSRSCPWIVGGDCSQDPEAPDFFPVWGSSSSSFSFLSMDVSFLGSSSIMAFMELGFHKTQRRWQHRAASAFSPAKNKNLWGSLKGIVSLPRGEKTDKNIQSNFSKA